ncbi:hypothetical protein DOM21_17050 [Bacteriovorax stolpii]|uniref:protein-glutamine glutaminase family protein n=1 Tax=Bacteriovorax stolpii TaxID=960 RepID=UPI00115AEB3A|nr:protein-glutamine glutaminase family protein [Bacteriovorax stolpii]QDK43130.1 hypothetical protein DOM21_17050 [Bacteriovorax stolpii]
MKINLLLLSFVLVQSTVFAQVQDLDQYNQYPGQEQQQGPQKDSFNSPSNTPFGGGIFGGMTGGFPGMGATKINPDDHPQITVKLANNQSSVKCNLDKEVKVYICPNGDKPVLVKNSPFGFTALSRDKENAPAFAPIENVVADGKTLYAAPTISPGMGMGMGGGMMGGYGGAGAFVKPSDLSTKYNESVMLIDAFFTNPENRSDNSLKTKGSTQYKSIVQAYMHDREEAKAELDRAYNEKSYKVQLFNGQEISCERGETRELTNQERDYQRQMSYQIKCGSFKCDPVTIDGKTYQATMLYDSAPNSMIQGTIHLLDEKDGIGPTATIKKITSPNSKTPLVDVPYDYKKLPMYGDYIKASVPQSLGQDRDKVVTYKDPNFEQAIVYYKNVCKDNKALNDLVDGKKKVLKKLGDLELAEFIQVIGNGNLVGTFVDPKKAPELGCIYQGVFLNAEAAKNLERIKKNIHPDRSVEQTITMERASELFKKAQKMDDIAWKYKPDGCYARAHLMARRFEEEGVRVDKVWIKGDLYVPGTEPLIQWNFHVAPIVYVKNAKGETQKMVIDPSLFDKPVTVEEWDNKMSKNTARGSVVTAFPFPENAAMMERSALSFSSSDPYLPRDSIYLSEQEKMDMANETMRMYKPLEPR